MSGIDIADDAAVRAALEAMLAALDAEESANADSRDTVVLDQTSVGRLSRMDAMQAREMAVAGKRRRETTRARIRSALARLAAGEFGVCVTCGEEIDPRRLEVDLTTPTCIACAARRA